MDRDKDAKLTYDEFVEGSKQDPTIVQVRTVPFCPSLRILKACYAGIVPLRWSRIVSLISLCIRMSAQAFYLCFCTVISYPFLDTIIHILIFGTWVSLLLNLDFMQSR